MDDQQFATFMLMLEAIRLAVIGNGQATLIIEGYRFPQDASAASDLLSEDTLRRLGVLEHVYAARPASQEPAP